MRKFYIILVSTLLFASKITAQEKGVSYQLATERVSSIANPHYTLHFTIPPITSEPIHATEVISFDLKKPVKEIVIDFNTVAANLKSVTLNGQKANYQFKNEHIIVSAPSFKTKGNEIGIEFIAAGNSLKREATEFVYCLFVPAKARDVFPCFDQPNLKASVTLKLTVSKEWKAVSNGSIIDSTVNGDWLTWSFKKTAPLSTYQFSFAAGKMNRYSETREGKTINFYYVENNKKKLDTSLTAAVDINFKALAFDAKYLNSYYPYEKFDFVEIPRFSIGGMEHPGAVFYNGNSLFMDQTNDTRIYSRNALIGHEVSHMWFGDWVTMKWFNEVWLKEVFASYIGDKFASSLTPVTDFNKKFLLANFAGAYSVDRFPSSEPIYRTLPNLNQAGLVYGPLTYNKAPIMMHQLELLIGEEAFQKGVQDYIKKYQGGNADVFDLLNEFQKYTKANLKEWSTIWLRNPGRPIIDAQLETHQGKISKLVLTQKGEFNPTLKWTQYFEVLLVYKDSISKIPVRIKDYQMELSELKGRTAPEFIVYNSSGEGYGVFPNSANSIQDPLFKKLPVETRALLVINAYEQALLKTPAIKYQNGMGPLQFLKQLSVLIRDEKDQQLLDRELRIMEGIYWKLLKKETRSTVGTSLEISLLEAMKEHSKINRTAIFKSYLRMANSAAAIDSMYHYWQTRSVPAEVTMSADDWNWVAQELALRNYKGSEILKQQLDSITNPNIRKTFSISMIALSENQATRDSLFNSFLKPEGRKNESDVATALRFLTHPLRQAESRKYIPEALKVLPEILATNDLFFAPTWLSALLDSYQDDQTVKILKEYCSKPHPEVPDLLMKKIKQTADWVFRANEVRE